MVQQRVIATKEDFSSFVAEVEGRPGYARPAAFGIGIATIWQEDDSAEEKVLDTRFLAINFAENFGTFAVLADVLGETPSASYLDDEVQFDAIADRFAPFAGEKGHANIDAVVAARAALQTSDGDDLFGGRRSRRAVVAVIGDLSTPPTSVPDAYLRLHLLSTRRTRPREINLDGVFGLLANVAWTSAGPIDPEAVASVMSRAVVQGVHLSVHGVDKFPRMLDYVVPSGVRIADSNRVRLGAHLAEGTTVMQEGFCNFNAGTFGPSMVEGRISAGVTVGAHSDIGGGASIMGTLSGGGKEVISVGEHCLIGANAGIGISIGDHCTVEAGLYLTAGTPVTVVEEGKETVVKAKQLSGADGLLFYRHGESGRVEAKRNGPSWTGLNSVLHQN